MLPDRVSNPGPLTYESGVLPSIGVGRLRILGGGGGARFRNLGGGARGGKFPAGT